MNYRLVFAFLLPFLMLCSCAIAQKLTSDIPYVENGHERHVLDIYTPEEPAEANLPVIFWIHGGGWQVGDKSDVALKPKSLTERGFVFVSTNYRLLPEVKMEDLIGDVARSLGWVHKNIARYGGDSERIFVGFYYLQPRWSGAPASCSCQRDRCLSIQFADIGRVQCQKSVNPPYCFSIILSS